MKKEIMWAIHGDYGFYTDTAFTRREMIRKHCIAYCPVSGPYPDDMLKRVWRKCRANGDRAVKVELKIVISSQQITWGRCISIRAVRRTLTSQPVNGVLDLPLTQTRSE